MIINFVAGPGVGKTTIAALVFGHLKVKGYKVEYVQEYAKNLVWQERYDDLNNQYLVSKKQYQSFKAVHDKVDYIVTDGSLLKDLYYNRYNKNNYSNVKMTEDAIMKYYREFDNLVIYLDRNNIPYEQEGRIQDETEAREIDKVLLEILSEKGIDYTVFPSSLDSVSEIIQWIETSKN
jgi:hypothetical protein